MFRSLKSELAMRTISHRDDNRIRAHVFIAVPAGHAVHLIRTRLKRAENELNCASIRNRLQAWVRSTTTVLEVGAGQIACRQHVLPTAEAAKTARRVGAKLGSHRRTNRRIGRRNPPIPRAREDLPRQIARKLQPVIDIRESSKCQLGRTTGENPRYRPPPPPPPPPEQWHSDKDLLRSDKRNPCFGRLPEGGGLILGSVQISGGGSPEPFGPWLL